jgi:hypothetical protein|tara:strand:+ start:212 stop:403 length:192 start_codon:yes stop_codon:yes gene_type:complete
MKHITSLEDERIKHVNAITNELHDSCDEIYESLIDHDYTHCKEITKTLILQLKSMIDSMDDDL